MYKTLKAPLVAHVEVNTGCNQICLHCYNFWRSSDPMPNQPMSRPMIVRVVQQLAEHKVFHVIINGGEPLMDMQSVALLMDKLSAAGISFSLNSNLSLLTESKARHLRALGLSAVLASLLSYDELTHNQLTNTKNSFKRVVNGIRIAKEAGLGVAVNMVVMTKNLDHVVQTGLFVKQLGAFAFSATRAIPPHTDAQRFDERLLLDSVGVKKLVHQLISLKNIGLQVDSLGPYPACFLDAEEEWLTLGNRTCSAGKTSIAIAFNGDVRACPHDENIYGSIEDDNISNAWSKMHVWRDGSLIPDDCKSCKLFAKCGGGCRVSSASGIAGADPLMRADFDEELLREYQTSVVKPQVTANTTLRVKRRCRFRNDGDIGIVNVSGIKNVLLTPETLRIIESLHQKNQSFSPLSLRSMYGINMPDEAYMRFLDNLLRRDVLQLVVA